MSSLKVSNEKMVRASNVAAILFLPMCVAGTLFGLHGLTTGDFIYLLLVAFGSAIAYIYIVALLQTIHSITFEDSIEVRRWRETKTYAWDELISLGFENHTNEIRGIPIKHLMLVCRFVDNKKAELKIEPPQVQEILGFLHLHGRLEKYVPNAPHR